MTKVCSKCKIEKPLGNYYSDRRRVDGKQSHCMKCFRFYKERRYLETTDEVKARARKSRLKRMYGITPEQWDEMFARQGGRCALCGKHASEFKNRLHTDHNHKSGKTRALVCFYCNRRRIGQLSLEWVRKLLEYFEKYDVEDAA